MALVAPIENGKVVETTSQSSLKSATKTGNDSMDKEAFLQLLVAQMKYQDPLQPTSNTEYISQYAQFSQVEQMQNMAASMDLQRASSLVGQEVYIKTTTSSGETKLLQGKVDYVVYENNKAYLSINEQLYALDDLYSVEDAEYLVAYNKAYDLNVAINKLPNINSIDLTYASEIDALEKTYNEMTDYEKQFVAEDVVKLLNQYIEKLEEVRLEAEENSKSEVPEVPAETTDSENPDITDDTEETDNQTGEA